LYLYENENVRKQMGEKGHNRVINEYSWQKIVDDYICVFKNTYER
jgi:glycosyltransferase involved in cell wall biosynthesis